MENMDYSYDSNIMVSSSNKLSSQKSVVIIASYVKHINQITQIDEMGHTLISMRLFESEHNRTLDLTLALL